MKDNFEKKLFQMADKEQILLPVSLERKVDERLKRLPEKRRFQMNAKKTLVLAAAMAMLFSITATAAGALRQRMEELQKAYEEEAKFPKGSLIMIDNATDYKGKNVSFLKETSTFFFPEKEMSDEQLLQIIDFIYKRDYSLQKINELINSGEIDAPQVPDAEIQGKPTEAAILQSKAVLNPGQELTIPYKGDLPLLYIAGGKDCIFLTGWNTIHKMEIGSGESVPFFNAFEKRTRITALCQDTAGDIYLALMQMDDSGRWQ